MYINSNPENTNSFSTIDIHLTSDEIANIVNINIEFEDNDKQTQIYNNSNNIPNNNIQITNIDLENNVIIKKQRLYLRIIIGLFCVSSFIILGILFYFLYTSI